MAMLGAACSDLPTAGPGLPGSARTEEAIQLEGVTGTACQYGGEYPHCNKPPTEAGAGQATMPPPDGSSQPGSGGGTSPATGDTASDTTKVAQPCNTGNGTLDSPRVQQGFSALWAASNPTGPQTDRREQVGWIVSRPDGYDFVPAKMIESKPCSSKFEAVAPAGTVAYVHTHPFAPHELVTACGWPPGEYIPEASVVDESTVDKIGLPRFVLDKQTIYQTYGSAYRIQQTWSRCGY